MLSHQVVEIFEEFTEYFAVFGIRTYDGLDATNKVCSGCNKILPYTNHWRHNGHACDKNRLLDTHLPKITGFSGLTMDQLEITLKP